MKKVLKMILVLTIFIAIFSCGKKGDSERVIFNNTEEAKTYDPQLATDQSATQVNELIGEGLTRKDASGTKVQPGIAEKWEVSQDGLKWTFHLRSNAKWNDGTPITANDFKYAWLRALNPETAAEYAYMLFPIKGAEEYATKKGKEDKVGIKVVDDKTLEVELTSVTPYFDSLVGFITYYPLNQKFYEANKSEFALKVDKMQYSGPYVLKEWVKDSYMILAKNPNYWDASSIKADTIEYKYISDNAAVMQGFNNEELDITRITSEQYIKLKDDKRVVKNFTGSVWYYEFNLNNKFLSNKKIRKAIQMAMNTDELMNKVVVGSGSPATGFVPEGMPGLKDDFRKEGGDIYPKYNPTEAKKLYDEGLKELGLTKAPKIEVLFNDSANNKKIDEYLQENIKIVLGLDLTMTPITFQERLKRMQNKTFDIIQAGWGPDYTDPMTYMDLWVTNGGNNHTSYSNPKYDELIKLAKSTGDQNIRMKAMHDAEKLLVEDMPIAPFNFQQRVYVVNPKVKGLKFKAVGAEVYLREITLD